MPIQKTGMEICDRPGEDYSTKYQHVIEKAQSEVKK